MKKKQIILDAGHGGISPLTTQYVTSGKRSPIWSDGSVYYEGVGNREIIKLLAQMLVKDGWTVLYTVDPNDYRDISLSKRVRISNEHYRKNYDAFQISLHSNGWHDPAANGCEVWTWPGQSKSDRMADVALEEMKKQFPWIKLRTDKSDGDQDKESRFRMNSVNAPSFLVESMFHTNEKECRVLMSTEGKYKIAKALFNSCLRIHKEL